MKTSPENLSTLAAAYMIFVGIAMLGMWTMFLLTGQVPELQTAPWSISLHLAAEFTTAILLLISGIAILWGTHRVRPITFFALGMLVYTVIQSPGYYIQLGQPAFVAMFAVSGLLAIFFAVKLAAE